MVGLGFSTLIKAFTDNVITPVVNAAGGGGAGSSGLGWTINGQRIDLGAFIAAVVYFIIFMAVIYFVLVVPYRIYAGRPVAHTGCRSYCGPIQATGACRDGR